MLDLLITVLLVVLIFGVITYAIQYLVVLDPPLKNLVLLVISVLFIIWVLLLLFGAVPTVRFPR